jgi:hypothetical protein
MGNGTGHIKQETVVGSQRSRLQISDVEEAEAWMKWRRSALYLVRTAYLTRV